MQNHDAIQLKAAKRIVKAELDSYDLLSRPAKIRYEHSIASAIDINVFGPDHGYVCGHTDTEGKQISLCSPCDKCCRTVQDCIEYQVALQSRLKALLSQLRKA
jgi:hypothetical protein